MSSIKLVQREVESMFDELQKMDLLGEDKTEEVAETGGTVLLDGRCIELVRDKTGNLRLFDSGEKRLAERVKCDGRIYVPPSLSPSLLEALTLPAGFTPSDSTKETFAKLSSVFVEHSMPESVAQKLTLWALSTWFADLLPVAPCLILTGPRPEASLVLRLLSSVVRHGLSVGAFDIAGFRSLPMHLQPTLLISDVSPSKLKLLAASNDHRAYLTREGLTDLYCAKALYAGPRLSSIDFESAFHIHLVPSRGKLPVLTDIQQRGLTAECQPRLVDYRIKHSRQVRDSEFDIPSLASEFRILARVLGSGIADEPELRKQLVTLLQEYQDETHVGAASPEAFVIEALLNLSHSKQADQLLYVGELAACTNRVLKSSGGSEILGPKAVGWILRNVLNLSPRRNARGFAMRLTEPVQHRIHQLAIEFQVWTMASGCNYCNGIVPVLQEKDKPAA